MTIAEAISTLRSVCATVATTDWATRVQIHNAMAVIEAELARHTEIPPVALQVVPNGHAVPAPQPTKPGVARRVPPAGIKGA